MKKVFLIITAILIALILPACSATTSEGTAPPPTQSAIASPSPTPSPTSSPSPLREPTVTPRPPLVPDTGIPDIVWGKEEPVNSCEIFINNFYEYRDKNNSYYLDDMQEYDCDPSDSYLLSRSLTSGKEIIISDKACWGFSYDNGMLYYIEYSYVEGEENPYSYSVEARRISSIMSYNTATGKKKLIKAFDNGIGVIACNKGNLYFTYNTIYVKGIQRQTTDLYVMSADGSGLAKIKDGVSSFCIYKDTIYYAVSPFDNQGDSICQCGLDGKGSKELVSSGSIYFQLYKDKLFYTKQDGPLIGGDYILDLITGQKYTFGRTCSTTIAGQYFFYIPDDNSMGNETRDLYAYDIESGITYSCLKISDLGPYLYTYGNRVGLDADGIYDLVIKNGKASLKLVSAAPDEGDDYEGEEGDDYEGEDGDDYEGEDGDDYEDPLSEIETKKPDASTVIIADSEGIIQGGYSGGIWLSPIEAAAYCKESIQFYKCSLSGTGAKVDSPGVMGIDCSSAYWNADMKEQESFYYKFTISGISAKSGCLISARPERFAQTSELSDTSSVLGVVQQRLNENFGEGKAEAQVNEAVTYDIDGDGSEEIIFNSRNIEDDDYDLKIEGDWYSLSGIIEEDGSVHLLGEYYETGLPEEMRCEPFRSIVDVDGDGRYELVAEYDDGGYTQVTTVYKYDGNTFNSVMLYGV